MSACLWVSLAAACVGSDTAVEKLPVPDPAARREAEKRIRENLREDYGRKGPELSAVAEKLLQLARTSEGDPTGRYVLFQEAVTVAGKAGNVALAILAVNEGAKLYHIDLLSRQLEALDGVTPRDPSGVEALLKEHARLFDEAFHADRYDIAAASAKNAQKHADKAGKKDFAALAEQKARDAEEVGREFSKAQWAGDTARKNTQDAQAAMTFGRFLCLAKGDWMNGLEFLARGMPAPLCLQAQKDLAAPSTPPQRVVLGDGWWELARGEKGLARRRLEDRSAYWYELALPRLEDAERLKVEQRLSEIELSRPGGFPRGAIIILTFDPKTLFTKDGRPCVRDQSGKENHGVLHGTTPTRGKAGGALLFDGVDDSVDCGAVAGLDAAGGVTLSAWISASSFKGGASDYIISKDDWANGIHGFVLRLAEGGTPVFTVATSTWTSVKGGKITKGQWQHLAATYGSGTIRLFLNGAVVDSSPSGGNVRPSSMNLSIGRGVYAKDRRLHGAIDEVAVFDRCLSEEEIRWLFQRGRKGQSLR